MVNYRHLNGWLGRVGDTKVIENDSVGLSGGSNDEFLESGSD